MTRTRWFFAKGYPNGWCVDVRVGGSRIGRYYGRAGGEWELLEGGVLGRQLVGTLDLRAPTDARKFAAWARRRLRDHVVEMRVEVTS